MLREEMMGIYRRVVARKMAESLGYTEEAARRIADTASLEDLERYNSEANAAIRRAEEAKDAEAAEKERRAEEEAREARYREFVENTVPRRYQDAEVKDFAESSPFYGEIGAMLEGESRLILGTNGIGKTRLAWALAKRWQREGRTVAVYKAQELLSKLKSWQKPDTDAYGMIRTVYGRELSLLIIDEIDKIYGSQADFLLLTYLIDIRYEDCLQTIVLGNKSKDTTVDSLIGSSSFSRLSGDGSKARYLVGADRRKEA